MGHQALRQLALHHGSAICLPVACGLSASQFGVHDGIAEQAVGHFFQAFDKTRHGRGLWRFTRDICL